MNSGQVVELRNLGQQKRMRKRLYGVDYNSQYGVDYIHKDGTKGQGK